MKYKAAIADFKRVLQFEPKNDLVRTQLDATQKIHRKSEFEKVGMLAFYVTLLTVSFPYLSRLLLSRTNKMLFHDAERSSKKVCLCLHDRLLRSISHFDRWL